ncbi:MAG: hypothetical protein ABFE13_00115 [Phycisphaerales bacterium]
MKKIATVCVVIAAVALNANADIHLTFTEVDVGSDTQVNLTNQFAAYGVTFDHVYRYIDGRDPWSEDYGISNGWKEENLMTPAQGRINFTLPTSFVTIDWWDIGTNQMHVDACDAGGNLIDSFIGPSNAADEYGTKTLSGLGLISYMTFNDGGGFVQIANMTFSPVPVPAAVLLGILGLGAASAKLRKFK